MTKQRRRSPLERDRDGRAAAFDRASAAGVTAREQLGLDRRRNAPIPRTPLPSSFKDPSEEREELRRFLGRPRRPGTREGPDERPRYHRIDVRYSRESRNPDEDVVDLETTALAGAGHATREAFAGWVLERLAARDEAVRRDLNDLWLRTRSSRRLVLACACHLHPEHAKVVRDLIEEKL